MNPSPVPLKEYKKMQSHKAPKDNGEPRPPAFSDEALGLRFVNRHASHIRYVAAWDKWFWWSGTHWAEEQTLLALDLSGAICREAASECDQEKLARAIASAKTRYAVSSIAKADRRLAGTVDQWDCGKWLLNTPSGVIDLKSGNVRPHDPLDYFTKITAAKPEGECPVWLQFLDRVTGGNKDLQSFIQRMAGYALTGDTSAHALFFLFGTGANGKSVFIDTLAGVLGDYHRTSPIETLTFTSNDRHSTDIARLRGARLVTASETEEGRRWAESRIKQMTGGDRMTARFMRQDYFEYEPQFKWVIAGNHKPGLRSVDEAIRRRFHLLPFTVTIPAVERDPNLKDKLKAEWNGILAWAVAGCLEWQRQGLNQPSIVQQATAEYLEAEDALAAWLDECCTTDPQAWEPVSALFSSFKAWAEKSGEPVGSLKGFSAKLETRGLRYERKNRGRGFMGYSINPVHHSSHWSDH